jgi:DNA invertase Pin-like site-specific DNA recombinase
MAVVGDARVSTQDQDFARQVEALEAAGAGRVYREKPAWTGRSSPS